MWAQGGWLREFGAPDFAGGTVVHMSSGVAALVAAIAIGRRYGLLREAIVLTTCRSPSRAGMLWFGWFGFNTGSALTAGGLAATATLG